ncbi:nuclear GTP-binding protein NUG1 [Uncinocarpus reesii 1704]|uniref:Nuclear GTP-binding protein NUG1 n=1 Tax=Uncinocarpus reesii (strain UAMH 1704) TaxID=336963 RepID=C4JQS3_UNCRE|nr:nuclear GTP-binding protein NUG1 [Uncinocarpus reesii 1704]EEP78559.1 nuclear GTP-binding protein NUG1 [Uncinocarpus reesii 1704]
MVKLGKTSKRTPVRLRHKIEKASAAKQRKQRKLAKKKKPSDYVRARQRNRAAGTEILPDAELVEDEQISQDDDLLDEDMADDADESNPMAALLASAKARAVEYAQQNGNEGLDDEDMDGMDEDDQIANGDNSVALGPSSGPRSKETSRRAFDKMFKQVIEAADVVLYVLDARDPEGTRSKEVEREIMAMDGGSKRLILVLNKIDLVPSPVLKGWLLHLRRYFPTLPLKAATNAANAQGFDHKQLTAKATSETLFQGAQILCTQQAVEALYISWRAFHLHVPLELKAGVTTNLREVKIDSKLKLIDSPGIVFPNSDTSKSSKRINEEARLILLNAIPPKQISDPVPAVTLLLKRLSTSEGRLSKMLEFYGIPPLFPLNGEKTNDFLIQVAKKRGRLGKGGVPNIGSAAMTVISDWRDGRIQGWVEAPILQVGGTENVQVGSTGVGPDTKQVVAEWSKEFKLDGLWGDKEIPHDEME